MANVDPRERAARREPILRRINAATTDVDLDDALEDAGDMATDWLVLEAVKHRHSAIEFRRTVERRTAELSNDGLGRVRSF